jgi:hypothetical protein
VFEGERGLVQRLQDSGLTANEAALIASDYWLTWDARYADGYYAEARRTVRIIAICGLVVVGLVVALRVRERRFEARSSRGGMMHKQGGNRHLVNLDDYTDFLAFADLRGRGEYRTEVVGDTGIEPRQVCGLVLTAYRPSAGGHAGATLLIELDRAGEVVADSLYLAPREAMNSWPNVVWEPLSGVFDVAAYVRSRFI